MTIRNGKGLTRRTVLGSGVGVAAAGLMSWPVKATPTKVKIGAIMPSSGVLAFPGQACVRGIDLGAKFAREKYGLDIEIVHADTQSRPENGRIAAEGLIRQGCTVLIGAWDSGATVEVAKAKASGADALVSVTRVNDAIMIARECIKQGWDPKMVFSPNSNGVSDKAYHDALGKYGNGPILAALWLNPKGPNSDKIMKMFATDYPNDWFDANAGCAFEAVQIVGDAVKRAASAESVAIHGALRTTDMKPILMYGENTKFDATGQNINCSMVMLQGLQSKPRVVAPKAIAEATLEYPLVPYSKR